MGTKQAPERVLATLFAGVFLLVSWGDAYGVHNCPHHDLMLVHGSDMASTSAMAVPTNGSVASDADDDSGAPSHGEGPCTCLGDCQSTAPEVFVPSPRVLVVGSSVDVVPAVWFPAASVALDHPPYRLPFANAPPRLI